jgi:hypothetical protein
LNGNTINQQINPLVKQLQNVASQYQASKASRPQRGGRKAPAQQPQQQATPQQESFERLFGSSIYL